jgi:hypothetical protein
LIGDGNTSAGVPFHSEPIFISPVVPCGCITTKGQSMARKYSKGAQKKVKKAMEERKKGTLRSGPGGKGGKVKSRKQAIAIGLSEARKEDKKVPKKAKKTRKTKKKTKR